MTEKLRTLLDNRADRVDFDAPDLDVIMARGSRTVRRRRAVVGAGGLAALAVVGGILLTQRGGDDKAPVAVDDPTPVSSSVSWAEGSVINRVGHDPVDVGHPITAYVETAMGVVFADPDGTVWSEVDGEVTEVGSVSTEVTRLVSDRNGSLVAWVDSSAAKPTVVVLDQSAGEVVLRDDSHTTPGMGLLADEANPVHIYALDGRTALWRDSRGAVSVDVDSGEVTVVKPDARNGFDIIDAEDGIIGFSGNHDGGGLRFGETLADAALLPEIYGSMGGFSPDTAAYYFDEADELRVFDLGTQALLDFDMDRPYAAGIAWLDATTLVVGTSLGEDESGLLELATCDVTTLQCEVLAPALGTFEEMAAGDFTLPIGIRISE